MAPLGLGYHLELTQPFSSRFEIGKAPKSLPQGIWHLGELQDPFFGRIGIWVPSVFPNDLKMVPWVPNAMFYPKVQEVLDKNDFPLVIQNGTIVLEIVSEKYSPKCLKNLQKI